MKKKKKLKERAAGLEIRSVHMLEKYFQEDNTSDYVDNTNVQEKDERISDLKTQIDDYKKQIEQLHTDYFGNSER